MAVVRALARAAPLVTERRVLALVFAPLAIGLVLWIVAAFTLWSPLRDLFAGAISRWIAAWGLLPDPGPVAWAGGSAATFIVLTLAAGALALAVVATLAGPVFVRAVATRHYPLLERRRGGTVAGGMINALVAIGVWLALWLVVLPLLLVPVIGVTLGLLQNAWLNQRLFRYDALAEHASPEERIAILRSARGRLLALGLAVAPLSLVPLVNLLSPAFAGLAFTCLCLDELAALRSGAAPH